MGEEGAGSEACWGEFLWDWGDQRARGGGRGAGVEWGRAVAFAPVMGVVGAERGGLGTCGGEPVEAPEGAAGNEPGGCGVYVAGGAESIWEETGMGQRRKGVGAGRGGAIAGSEGGSASKTG